MTDQRIVVTGANRGLGLEFVRRYLEAGHRVLAAARDPDSAPALRELAAGHGDRAFVARCDVGDSRSIAELADAVPWDSIDLLVNNAGVFGGEERSLEAIDFEDMERTFRINSLGPLRVTRALLPWLVRARGKVAHVTSKMGSIDDNTSGGRYSYRMSKAALNMAVRSLGYEFTEQGLCTFVIHPGWVQTDMGGPAAPLGIEESVASMIDTIAARTPADNGLFFDRDGQRLPW
jgi:NAD(P)-dependent dehydrogenase (short-subunit alcohol dehydrogenase family)